MVLERCFGCAGLDQGAPSLTSLSHWPHSCSHKIQDPACSMETRAYKGESSGFDLKRGHVKAVEKQSEVVLPDPLSCLKAIGPQ